MLLQEALNFNTYTTPANLSEPIKPLKTNAYFSTVSHYFSPITTKTYKYKQ